MTEATKQAFPLSLRYGVEFTVATAEELEDVAKRAEELEAAFQRLFEETEPEVAASLNPPCWVLDSESVVGQNVRTRTYPTPEGHKEVCQEHQAIYLVIWKDINNNNRSRTSKRLGLWETQGCIPVPNNTPDLNSP